MAGDSFRIDPGKPLSHSIDNLSSLCYSIKLIKSPVSRVNLFQNSGESIFIKGVCR